MFEIHQIRKEENAIDEFTAKYFAALQTFRREIARAWLEALRRRSQRARFPWERFRSLLDRYLPLPRILHPEPGVRFDARYPR